MPGSGTNDGWAAPQLSELIVRSRPGAGHPLDANAQTRVVAELMAVRGPAGRFMVPSESPATAARSVIAYNRLRPVKVRAARAAISTALLLGGARFVSEPRRIMAPPDAAVLLEHLASVLGEPRVVFAGTEKGGSGFVTPVLQLFTPDGRAVGFAKLGWDPVTIAMVRTEAEALERAARAGWSTVFVPEVRWHGGWEGLELLVTAPMPRRVRRLRPSELPPVEPLLEVATLDGAPSRADVTASSYWVGAIYTADIASECGRSRLRELLDVEAEALEGLELRFGRWHGDWVEWNLATANGRLYAWDWAYSAPDVPIGFDLLQFFHLRHLVLRAAPPEVALDRAAADATPGLRRLGLSADERRGVVALHRIEVLLREERAQQARAGLESRGLRQP